MDDVLDPTHNHVTFHLVIDGVESEASGVGPARAVDCVAAIWGVVSEERGLDPEDVRQIYSEWEPSPEDLDFLDRTFPQDAELAFTFKRPPNDNWDTALKAAAKVIRASGFQRVGGK